MARRRPCHHLRPCDGERTAGISVKSAPQVTRGGFPKNFVATAWAQWFGVKTDRKLSGTNDAIVLVTGSLAPRREGCLVGFAARRLADNARAHGRAPVAVDPGRGSQSSALQRALFESLRCPAELRGYGDASDGATVDLMRHLRLLHFDYESTPSRDHAAALADCQRILRSGDAAEAQSLWQRLTGIADERRTGGAIDLAQTLDELRGEFDLREHPDYRRDAELLERLSRDLMADVRTQIAGVPPLPRAAERATVQDRLEAGRACLLVGEFGMRQVGAGEGNRGITLRASDLDRGEHARLRNSRRRSSVPSASATRSPRF